MSRKIISGFISLQKDSNKAGKFIEYDGSPN